MPAIRLRRGQEEVLFDVEIFDYDTWRTRPAFNLANPQNIRISIPLGPVLVTVFEPNWLLKEKIRIQHQREGTLKELTDLEDIAVLVNIVVEIVAATGAKSLMFNQEEEIDNLKSLLRKCPDLISELEEVIDCPEVFSCFTLSETS